MKNLAMDPVFHEYAALVIHKLQSDEISSVHQDYSQFLSGHIQGMKEWQIALPVIACLAAGGTLEDGVTIASAWAPLYLASDILDDLEDKEFEPERFLSSSEVASNLATSLIFAAFHTLATISDTNKASQIIRVFSRSGFEATTGQHRDLIQTRSPVEIYLNNYWEITILKSGSVFRAVTEGGALAGTCDEPIVEALGDYGTALGVMLQLIDDCRDAFSHSQDAIKWEISLPLLLYLMTIGEEKITFPEVHSQAEWADLLQKTGMIQAISALLLEWKSRALASLRPLRNSREKQLLESIPALFLESVSSMTNEVIDENTT